MSRNRRGGLGRGIGALIPTAPVVSEQALADEPADDAPVRSDATVALDEGSAPDQPAPDQPATAASSVDVSRETSDLGSLGSPGDASDIDLIAVPGAYFREISVDAIRANAKQPRTIFDDDSLAELAHSIREFGVLQPVVVRAVEDGYELVMGERRLRAAVAAGLTAIPAVVRDTADDAMLRDALLENIHRAQLNPLEEAAAYQQLLEEFGVTHEELAARIGRSRSQVSNTVRLMNLSVPVQRRVAAGVLSAGHARALLGLADSEAQDELAGRIVAEGLSVRATEELVALAGREGPAKRRRPVRRFTAPAAHELAEKLSDAFDTRVKVDIGRHKGKITVEFASIADLERIIDVMVPGLNPRVPTSVGDTD